MLHISSLHLLSLPGLRSTGKAKARLLTAGEKDSPSSPPPLPLLPSQRQVCSCKQKERSTHITRRGVPPPLTPPPSPPLPGGFNPRGALHGCGKCVAWQSVLK
ncbi:hypothetical protein CLOP_g5019 [Closterium sp. NIES-67]|nr:hypothetical protein CLOP_g5019 [Closterium sp. NIES-67]